MPSSCGDKSDGSALQSDAIARLNNTKDTFLSKSKLDTLGLTKPADALPAKT
jgi:hypothetical protein